MKLARSSSLLLLALAGLVGALLLTLSPKPGPAPNVSSASGASEPEDSPRPSDTQLAPLDSTSKVRVAAERSPSPPSDLNDALEGSSNELSIHGVVVLEGADSVRQTALNGSMYLSFDYGHGLRFVPVEVAGGRWKVRFALQPNGYYTELGPDGPLGETFFVPEFQDSLIRATSADFGISNPIAPSAMDERFMFSEKQILIRLHLLAPLSLRVEDAQTGAPLDRVSILDNQTYRSSGETHPGGLESGVIVQDGSSPIEIDPTRFESDQLKLECLVGRDGYQWQPFTLDLLASEPQHVQLQPGGDLQLEFIDPPANKTVSVYLYGDDSRDPDLVHNLYEQSSLLITGLAVRSYKLRVKLQHTWTHEFDDPPGGVLARTDVTIQAGKTQRLTLDLSIPNGPDEGHAAGGLILPQAWELANFSLRFEPIEGAALIEKQRASRIVDAFAQGGSQAPSEEEQRASKGIQLDRASLTQSAEREDVYLFDLGKVTTGTYKLTLVELGQSVYFEVGREGRSDILLEVAEPVWINVQVRNSTSGGEALVPGIQWASTLRGAPSETGSWQRPHQAEPASLFRLRVPRSPMILQPSASDAYYSEQVEIQPEPDLEVQLDVDPKCGIKLSYRCEGVFIPSPYGWTPPQLRRIGGTNTRNAIIERRDQEFLVRSPGRYRLSFHAVPAFETPRSLEVEIAAGQIKATVVELRRVQSAAKKK